MGSWDLDRATRELTWSEAACKLFGISSPDPVSYDLLISLLESDDRERTEQAIRQDGGRMNQAPRDLSRHVSRALSESLTDGT
jgi:two-component system, LuxR family, sensor kinase FixL